jgi:hypothetical protein
MRRSASRSVTVSNAQHKHNSPAIRCMVNHVARLAVSHHSPFLLIFQEAAARAYLRVQCGSSPANSNVGPTSNAPSRTSFGPTTNHLWCASPRMSIFFVSHSTAAPRIPNFPPLCNPAAVCKVNSCGITRHEPRRNHLRPFPSLVICPHYPLEEISRSVPLPARTANDPSRRAMF